MDMFRNFGRRCAWAIALVFIGTTTGCVATQEDIQELATEQARASVEVVKQLDDLRASIETTSGPEDPVVRAISGAVDGIAESAKRALERQSQVAARVSEGPDWLEPLIAAGVSLVAGGGAASVLSSRTARSINAKRTASREQELAALRSELNERLKRVESKA